MRDVHVIRDLEQLKGLSDPLRFRVVKALMERAMSTAELAKALDETPNKLHYHVAELDRLGLIMVIETREKGNLIERVYAPVAAYFRIDAGLFRQSREASDVMLQNAQALLDTTVVDLDRLARADNVGLELSRELLQTHLRLRLSPDDLDELRERLRALLNEFGERDDPQAASEARLTVMVYPWSDELEMSDD